MDDERKFDEELRDNASVIYTLRLEHSCFWIEKHYFVEVEEIFQLKNGKGEQVEMDEFMGDAITLKLMRQHGIEHVRGGRYCKVELDEEDRKDLQELLKPESCYLCHEVGHFFNECPTKASLFSLWRTSPSKILRYGKMLKLQWQP